MPFIAAAVGAIGSLVASSGAFLAGIGFLGRAVVGIALNIGLNALANAFKPKPPAAVASGAQLSLQSGESVPTSGNFGIVALPGDLKYWNTYGASNNNLQLGIVLGEGWNQSLEGVIIDGILGRLVAASITGNEVAAFTVNHTSANITAGLINFGTSIKVRFYDGRPGQLADTSFVTNSNPAGRWTANDKFTGKAWVAVEMTYDDTKFQGSVPSFTWIMKGLRLYDWRKDSTNTGSGAHRWDDTSTWEWSENAAVCRYNYQRGIFINGHRVCGQGVAIYDLIHDLYTAAANVCGEVVLTDIGSEPRYRLSLIATDDVQFTDVLKEIDQAMAGFQVERQGAFGPLVGAAQTSIDTITDDDLVTDEAKSWTGKRSRKDLFNAVFGQFLDPNVNWQMNSYPPIIDTDLEIEDGERLVRDGADLPAVPSVTQALRIATIRLNQIREQATATVALGFNKVWYEAGDWITWNSAKHGNRKYMIMTRTISANRRVILELAETATAVFSGAIVEPETPSAPHGLPGTLISTVANFNIQADTITNDAGRVMPALRFTWDPPNDPTIEQVIIEYRRVGAIVALRIADNTPEDGLAITTNGIVGGADYEARATIITRPARPVTFTSPWVSITTDDEVVIATASALSDELNALLDRVRSQIPNDLFTIRADIDALSTAISTHVSRIQESEHKINIGIGERYEQNKAGVELAQLTSVNTREALAALFVNLFAITDAGEADVDVRFIADSAPEGVLASVAIEVKVTDGVTSEFVKSGFYIDAMSGPSGLFSRIRLIADQIVLANPDNSEVIDAFLLVVADVPLDTPILAGTVQVDLRQRRLIHKTFLNQNVEVLFPIGARPGFQWTHIFEQDATGSHAITVDQSVFINDSPTVLPNPLYSSECHGTVLSDNPPKATLVFITGGNTALGDNTSFSIFPPVNGQFTWDVAADGPLNITVPGTYTIKPLGSWLNARFSLLGPGGSTGGIGASHTDGGAGTDTTFAGMVAAAGGATPGAVAQGLGTAGGTPGTSSGGDTNTQGIAGTAGFRVGTLDANPGGYTGGNGSAPPAGTPSGGAAQPGRNALIGVPKDAVAGNAPGAGASGASIRGTNGSTAGNQGNGIGGGASGGRSVKNFTGSPSALLGGGAVYILVVGDSGVAGTGTGATAYFSGSLPPAQGARGAPGAAVIS